jgi:hypothetical protein
MIFVRSIDTFITFVFLVIAIILFCPTVSFSWNGRAHTLMAIEALYCLPESLHSELVLIRLTVREPDEKRVIDHCNVGQCAWMIDKLAKKSIKQLQAGENWDVIYSNIGHATHYIQDLNCPHHGIGYYQQGAHERFESKVNSGYWDDTDFDGFQRIEKYNVFAYNAARFSKRYIKYCNKLRTDFGSWDYYKTLIDPLWDRSVNDCIDLWLSILYDGLGEDKYREKGLPEMVGTRATKKLKFPKVDPFDYPD